MNKVKILFMLSSMNIGGVEKSLLSLLSIMPKEKYDVTVLLLEKTGGFLKSIPAWVKVEETDWFADVKPVITQPPQETVKTYLHKGCYLKAASFLFTYFISKHFDNRYLYYKQVLKSVPRHPDTYDLAIAYQGPTDVLDLYVADKVTSKRKLSWVHFDVSRYPMNQKLYDRLYKKFDKVMIVSEEAKKQLLAKIPALTGKTHVFFNIVAPDTIHEMSKEPASLDPDFKGIKIVTVGRLSKEKGQDMAIHVLHKLRREGYPVRWYCVGEGSAREEYERLIRQYNLVNDFILLGSTSNPYPYIADADLYVQTSRHEGYCLTLAEAKCLRKPIVTTNFIGAYEQIKDGYNGLIVENGAEQLYEKTKYLLDHPLERKKLSDNLAEMNIEEEALEPKLFQTL